MNSFLYIRDYGRKKITENIVMNLSLLYVFCQETIYTYSVKQLTLRVFRFFFFLEFIKLNVSQKNHKCFL